MELIRKQVRMNQMGKTVTDQFMIGGDYNVPDAKRPERVKPIVTHEALWWGA